MRPTAISSAAATWVTFSARPPRSGVPRRSTSAGMPATPMATPVTPLRHARPKLSLIDDADVGRRPPREVFPDPARGGVGILRQEQRRFILRRHVGLVYARARHHETEPVLDDQHARLHAQHLARLAQDQLDQARIPVAPPRKLLRARRGHDIGEPHAAPFGLGDDLLRDHQHVAVLQALARARHALPASARPDRAPAATSGMPGSAVRVSSRIARTRDGDS